MTTDPSADPVNNSEKISSTTDIAAQAGNLDELASPEAPKSSVAKMAMWDFAGRIANFGVTFVVGIALTRLLLPAEFGAFAIVLSITSLSSIFIDLGFRSAIVQSREVGQGQLSTIFYINLLLSLILTGILWVFAAGIETFYHLDGLRLYIFGASLVFSLNAMALVSSALLQKQLEFRKMSIVNTVAAAVSGITAIFLAYFEFRIWALVAQQVISAAMILFGLTFYTRWRPGLYFNLSSIRALWSYGYKLFISGFSDTIFTRVDVFIIGKLFPIEMLGFYNRAQSLDSLVKNFSASTTTSVAFPVIAKMPDDTEAVHVFYTRCLNVIAFLSFLLIGVLFLGCFDIVTIVFTEKWITTGYYFRIMALTGFIYPISALMVNLIAARGKSGSLLKLEMVKKAILYPSYLAFLFGGIYVFLISLGSLFIIALAVNAYFVAAELSISVKEQLTAIFKYAAVAAPIIAITFFAGRYFENVWLHLIISSVVYTLFYLLACFKLNLLGFREIFDRALAFYNDKRHANLSPAA